MKPFTAYYPQENWIGLFVDLVLLAASAAIAVSSAVIFFQNKDPELLVLGMIGILLFTLVMRKGLATNPLLGYVAWLRTSPKTTARAVEERLRLVSDQVSAIDQAGLDDLPKLQDAKDDILSMTREYTSLLNKVAFWRLVGDDCRQLNLDIIKKVDYLQRVIDAQIIALNRVEHAHQAIKDEDLKDHFPHLDLEPSVKLAVAAVDGGLAKGILRVIIGHPDLAKPDLHMALTNLGRALISATDMHFDSVDKQLRCDGTIFAIVSKELEPSGEVSGEQNSLVSHRLQQLIGNPPNLSREGHELDRRRRQWRSWIEENADLLTRSPLQLVISWLEFVQGGFRE